jgi:hypothetical protein
VYAGGIAVVAGIRVCGSPKGLLCGGLHGGGLPVGRLVTGS